MAQQLKTVTKDIRSRPVTRWLLLLAVLCLIVFTPHKLSNITIRYLLADPISKQMLNRIILDTSRYPELTRAMIQVESGGRLTAVSCRGAIGLMQVMPLWERRLIAEGIINGLADLFRPGHNIRSGEYILSRCIKLSGGNLRKALMMYSGGASGYYEKVMMEMRNNRRKDMIKPEPVIAGREDG